MNRQEMKINRRNLIITTDIYSIYPIHDFMRWGDSPFNVKAQKAVHRFRVSSNPPIAIGHRHNYVYVDTEHALIALIAVLDHGYTVDKYMGYE